MSHKFPLPLQDTFDRLYEEYQSDPAHGPWDTYISEGLQLLQGQEVDFSRPAQESDKLYMNIGGNDVIEVGHPPVPEEAQEFYRPGAPTVRSGTVGAGKPVIQEDALRQDFSLRHNCVSFDTEFDQVLESIVGNRKDSFAFIRGVSDYLDGSKNTQWSPYSALAAAAFTKALIEALPPPQA